MKTIALIDGHPDPARGRFCNAIADAYAMGAEGAGHTVHRINLSDHDFPLLRTAASWSAGPPPGFEAARDALAASEHLVIVFPLWLGGMPALLKGFLEQVTAGGFAIAPSDGGRKWTQKFKGKSARVIVTMGMPGQLYRYYFQAHSLKSLERNILGFAGVAPIRDTVIGLVDALGDAKRKRFLSRIEKLGSAVR